MCIGREAIVFKSELTSDSSLLLVWMAITNRDTKFFTCNHKCYLMIYNIYTILVTNDVVAEQVMKLQTTDHLIDIRI